MGETLVKQLNGISPEVECGLMSCHAGWTPGILGTPFSWFGTGREAYKCRFLSEDEIALVEKAPMNSTNTQIVTQFQTTRRLKVLRMHVYIE